MANSRSKSRPLAVPSSRARRVFGLGSMASGIAGNVAARGLQQLVSGKRPTTRDLLLTPANVTRIADQLARMRGAAMKVGQLISMDAGEVLPPELAQIMARLRADADYMPPRQLKKVLTDEWGEGWLRKFQRFDVRPIASASIGQVHRATTRGGRDLAIKVQYPGIARSIDSDIQNVATLMRMSGLLPAGMDITPFLEEAKNQLHQEADYLRERDQIRAFVRLLEGNKAYSLPLPYDDLTTSRILAMQFIQADPIEEVANAPQPTRNMVVSDLISLMFQEVFEFGLIQSDPNFANYRYNRETGEIVLLDFGATRRVPKDIAENYASLFRSAFSGNDLRGPAIALGFFTKDTAERHQQMILDMLNVVFDPLRKGGLFDFADPGLSQKLHSAGMELADDGEFAHVPPTETLFLQRKFGGLYLLGARLGAKVDISKLIHPYL